MVEAASGLGGKLDILVNIAAIEDNAPVVQMDPAVWRQTVEVNLTGPFLMMKAAIPKMIEGGGAKHLQTDTDGVFASVAENVPLNRIADPADIAGVFGGH